MNQALFQSLILESQRRTLPDYARRDLDVPSIASSATAIVGNRRCGKTYRTYQFCRELLDAGTKPEQICRIQFNDLRLRAIDTDTLLLIDQSYYALYPSFRDESTVYFIFDEIHRIRDWELYVLQLLDNQHHRVLVTGSTSKILTGNIASGLRGKCLTSNLLCFSFREYLRYHAIEPETVSPKGQAYCRNAFRNYMDDGGFAGAYALDPFQKTELLQTYWETMLMRDVLEAHPADALHIEMLLFVSQALISRVGCPMTLSKVRENARLAGLSFADDVPARILRYLEEAFALYTVPFFSRSERVRNRRYQKVYACDWALAHSVGLAGVLDDARLFENCVFLELKRRRNRLYYYQTKKGHEVDFVAVPRDNSPPKLVQVCHTLTEDSRRREIRPIGEAGRMLGISEVVVVTMDEEESLNIDGIGVRVVPAWKWFLECT